MTCSIDVLAIDLDGTLLGPDGRVSRANADAVAEARLAGLDVVIATGRALIECREALGAIDHSGAMIGAGGAVLSQAATGRTIDRQIMPLDVVDEVARALVHHDHKALLLKDADATGYDYLAVGPAPLDPSTGWWFAHLPVRVRFVDHIDDDPDPGQTLRVGTIAPHDELLSVAMQLREDLGDRALLQHWAAVAVEQSEDNPTYMLEVFNTRVSKWAMLRVYAERYGHDPERIGAIGDGLNDVSMVEGASIGIAMANADDAVRAVADRVTDSSHEDGVARAIERILEQQW